MISKPLGIRVADVEADGDFDTHDDQAELGELLGDVSECLAAFQADLEARGVADRVLTFVWSEFGRRPEENGSGTDHGAGGLAWVQGDRARAGVHSEYPEPQRARRARQPAGDDRLPARLLEPARAVPRHRRERGDPATPGPSGAWRWSRDSRAAADDGEPRRPAHRGGRGRARVAHRALPHRVCPTGRVRFNVRNFGEDGHDLAVRNRRDRVLGHLPELRPDETARLTVRLRRPGRYVVFCSLEGHEAKGMRATLRVKKRRR